MGRFGWMAGVVPLLYPVLVHAAVVTGSPDLRFLALAVLVVNVLGPWLVRGRVTAWGVAIVLIAAAALAVHTAGALIFFYATPVLVCIALAWFFGRTLLAGRTALITRLARAIRGPLPRPVARYTRAVTVFWCATMAVMAVVNLALAVFAPVEWWSLCTNFLNYAIVGVLFMAEWFVRQRAIGEYEDMSWRQYLTALRRVDYRTLGHG
ncbi:hypothetical protein [Salinisphaera hydrothermalis]|uniref:Ketosynthase n=1 Tax=Salinisphaera hydrothermalis (strain C41B8) TaxID=1304275 RepID=A0A084IQ60_SALHC|nr:hypothetical protein [Salinisphaera hydrothermalis]KEZ78844.1 hypothetical protein C41B8_01902 [Salinisphaera hydrothermalis C41B8]